MMLSGNLSDLLLLARASDIHSQFCNSFMLLSSVADKATPQDELSRMAGQAWETWKDKDPTLVEKEIDRMMSIYAQLSKTSPPPPRESLLQLGTSSTNISTSSSHRSDKKKKTVSKKTVPIKGGRDRTNDPILNMIIRPNRPKQVALKREYAQIYDMIEEYESSENPEYVAKIPVLEMQLDRVARTMQKLQRAGAKYYEKPNSLSTSPTGELVDQPNGIDLGPFESPFEKLTGGEALIEARNLPESLKDEVLKQDIKPGKGKQLIIQQNYAKAFLLYKQYQTEFEKTPTDPILKASIETLLQKLHQMQQDLQKLQKAGARYHQKLTEQKNSVVLVKTTKLFDSPPDLGKKLHHLFDRLYSKDSVGSSSATRVPITMDSDEDISIVSD